MTRRFALAVLVLASLVLSQEDTEMGGGVPPSVVARKGTVRNTLDRDGTFVPAAADELKLELDSYRGELSVVDVIPHGSFVNEGDVILRLDTTGIDERIAADAMALERAQMGLRHAEEGERLRAEADAEALARAETAAARAAKRLRGYREFEKGFEDESERMSIQAREYRLEDQKDELDQLEKMYQEDELVDATEEIVLKRSRRSFAQAQQGRDLSERRRKYNKEWYDAWREEDLVREAETKAADLDRTKLKQAMAREKAESDLAEKRYQLQKQLEKFDELKKDREKFTVHSPRRGILLHGAAEDAPWGRLEKGSQLKNKAVFATVADPKQLQVVTNIPEADILKIKSGTAVEVKPDAAKDVKLLGRIEVEYLPSKGNVFKATVQLPEADLRIRPGFTCKASVILEEARDAVIVPKTALIDRDGAMVVRCAKTAAGPFEERQVVTGISDDENVVIREGVAEGDYVAVEAAGKSGKRK